MHYKPSKAMPAKLKDKRIGITFPAITTPDTGLHRIKTLVAERYRIWYHVGRKKRYVLLPRGTTLEEARKRRDTLYANLKTNYGARQLTAVKTRATARKPYTVTLTPGKYVYRRPGFVVKICGKQVAEAWTEEEADRKRDAWLLANAARVPHIDLGGIKP